MKLFQQHKYPTLTGGKWNFTKHTHTQKKETLKIIRSKIYKNKILFKPYFFRFLGQPTPEFVLIELIQNLLEYCYNCWNFHLEVYLDLFESKEGYKQAKKIIKSLQVVNDQDEGAWSICTYSRIWWFDNL